MKVLVCGINAQGAYTSLKMAIFLHKTALVHFPNGNHCTITLSFGLSHPPSPLITYYFHGPQVKCRNCEQKGHTLRICPNLNKNDDENPKKLIPDTQGTLLLLDQ